MPTPAALGTPRVAASTSADTGTALREVVAELDASSARVVLCFASPRHDTELLARGLAESFPGALTAGCTTAGELGPTGLIRGGVSAIALGAGANAAGVLLDDLAAFRFEHGRDVVATLADQLGVDTLVPDRHVLVTLTDGLSGLEEILVASLGVYASGIGLVGGSAADDFAYRETRTWLGGRSAPRSAVVLALAPGTTFHPFHVHHFRPTEQRVVVTDADPSRRIVGELDGWPAAHVLADLLGVALDTLRDDTERVLGASGLTLGIRAGRRHYLRAPMTLVGDRLLMGGAVEEGAVLQVMRAGDLVARTRAGVRAALVEVPSPTSMLLFSCGGRLHEATAHQCADALHEAMRPVPSAGFVTYGEQFGPMLVNFTLTGLVLGA